MKKLLKYLKAVKDIVPSPEVVSVGDSVKRSHVFCDEDIDNYADLVNDHNLVHFVEVDGEEGRLVHGMLVSSLASGLVAEKFPGSLVTYMSTEFQKPVFSGEEIEVSLTVDSIMDNYILLDFHVHKDGEIRSVGECVVRNIFSQQVEEDEL